MSEFRFQEGEIDGYFVMTRNSFDDHRGSFSRLYSRTIFRDNIDFAGIEHVNLSINPAKHTLRGFHYSLTDAGEKKIFHCITGSIFNVTVDVRKNSATYGKKKVIEVSSNDKLSIMVPAGCANAWMTTQADTQILYLVSAEYQISKERGFRYDDPEFGIKWPAVPSQISQKDSNWMRFES